MVVVLYVMQLSHSHLSIYILHNARSSTQYPEAMLVKPSESHQFTSYIIIHIHNTSAMIREPLLQSFASTIDTNSPIMGQIY